MENEILIEMVKSRIKESDCRIKGWVLDLEGIPKSVVKQMHSEGLKFDMIFGIGEKGDYLHEWNFIQKNCWKNVRKLWVENDVNCTSTDVLDRVSSHLQFIEI